MHLAIKPRTFSDSLGSARADSRFGRYKREVKQPVRELDLNESSTLSQIKTIWAKFTYDREKGFNEQCVEVFELLKTISCSAKDVERFSLALAEFQDEKCFSDKAGVFLSAIINNSEDSNFIVHTSHLSEDVLISGIGYKNTKNIIVEGNAGNDVGWCMSSGRILINGDAEEFVGWAMEGGKIIIAGYASSGGEHAIGGKIIVRRGLSRIGEKMGTGCEIHSFGKWSPHIIKGDVILGKVFHNGKLISPETERI